VIVFSRGGKGVPRRSSPEDKVLSGRRGESLEIRGVDEDEI
jgi:hypothetical protein